MHSRGINKNNLTYIKIETNSRVDVKPNLRVATVNVSSIKNKDRMVIHEIQDSNIDITLLMETWLKGTEHDKAWVNQSDLRTGSFDVLTHNRAGDVKGGGIALLFRKELNIKQIQLGSLQTIEYGIWKYIHKNKLTHIIGIYHPSPSVTNNTSNEMFVDDLMELITNSSFNIHMENHEDNDAIAFSNTMEAMGLEQHISGPTHKLGNTLDIIFTGIISELKIITHNKHTFISDHCVVSIDVNINKLQHQRTNKKIRKTTKLTKEAMMGNFHPPNIESGASLSEAYNHFSKQMLDILDRIAPEKKH